MRKIMLTILTAILLCSCSIGIYYNNPLPNVEVIYDENYDATVQVIPCLSFENGAKIYYTVGMIGIKPDENYDGVLHSYPEATVRVICAQHVPDYREFTVERKLNEFSIPTMPKVCINENDNSKYNVSFSDTAEEDMYILYTTDGSDPREETQGRKLYNNENIELNHGTHLKTVKLYQGKFSPITDNYLVNEKDAPIIELIGNKIVISHANDAEIFYTTDGTEPRFSTTRIKYKEPFTPTGTVKAVAFYAGIYTPVSESSIKGYQIEEPIVTLDEISESIYYKLSIESPYQVHYSIDGTTPDNSCTLYTSPITVKEIDNLQIVAWDPITDTYSNVVKIDPIKLRENVATPTIYVDSSNKKVTINTNTEGAKIYYTTDGTSPIINNKNTYNETFSIEDPIIIKAVAEYKGIYSPIATFNSKNGYAPTPSLKYYSYAEHDGVIIEMNIDDKAEIYFTTDGSLPSATNGRKYNEMIHLTSDTYFMAVCYKNGNYSDILSMKTKKAEVKAPSYKGYYNDLYNSYKIIVNTSDESDIVYYTTDQTDPRTSNTRKVIDESFSCEVDSYLQMVSCRDNCYSEVISIKLTKLNAPSIHFNDNYCTLKSDKKTSIYYTTDGEDPATSSSRKEYTENFFVSSGEKVKAVAMKDNLYSTTSEMTNSAQHNDNWNSYSYPKISYSWSDYAKQYIVTIDEVEGCSYTYVTLNGKNPSLYHEYIYNDSFFADEGKTIKAVSYKNGEYSNIASVNLPYHDSTEKDSNNTDSNNNQIPPAPYIYYAIANEASGLYVITILPYETCNGIYYTTNGNTPTSVSTNFTENFYAYEGTTIKAIVENNGKYSEVTTVTLPLL